ncbi:MAG: glycogen synthase GlgA [Planctomycetota bacterium]
MHVVSVSSEMVPFAKTGGLGDVCGALPPVLTDLGIHCTAFLPAYRSVLNSGIPVEATDHTFTIPIAEKYVACRLLKTTLPGTSVPVYLIDQPHYFDRDGLYADNNGEYPDSCERFCFYNRAVAEAIHCLKIPVDILHCHDWQTGLMPAFAKTNHRDFAWTKCAKTVMTIHNLAYQGRYWHLDMPLTGLSWDYFNWKQMEFHGDLNLLKTGIVFADQVTTVSPTYAQEITTEEFGCGLERTLAERGSDLLGIVNGVDYAQWNPATDPHLPQNYDLNSWRDGKAKCKVALQAELGLDVCPEKPLIGIVSRLADQKGWDLIIPLLLRWAADKGVQWAILGTGDKKYEKELADLASYHPENLAVQLAFSERMAHRIEAACDLFMMPSRYEPCGLNQLYSLKYGSVPLVNATGGLVDTVVDSNDRSVEQETATGFICTDYSLATLDSTLKRALEYYLHQKPVWAQIVTSGMNMDWSWEQSARRYQELYERLLASP